MTELQTRLQSALGDAYRVERELGGGGMSRVFVATEVELARRVVVKVLPPEMAAGLNAERFRREIQLAASLQHPHIVPLIAAGRAGDLVWYTMPFIEGESLRARLARERELPVTEVVRILRDVTDALSYAHEHGVVHRDIKPDNVLMTGRHAVVTDFGVAKAVSASTGESSLTSIGVALGTPSYMAPEQASADPYVDHRADIYSVGAMAYEMLTGRPPFEGAPQMVLAAHVTQSPEPVTQRRATVPPALASLVMRSLEKKAADRWQSASEVHQQLELMATPSGGAEPTSAIAAAVSAAGAPRAERPARRMPAGLLAAASVVVAAVVALALWKPWASSATVPLDPGVVGVLPFRVAGADPSLHYLRQGMVDLLQTKLTGEGGPRAADARSVLAAFRDAGGTDESDVPERALLPIAQKIGAARLVQGSVVGPPEHVVVAASLLEMPGARVLAQTSVEGPKDSLFAMVDRLSAQLLALGAGASSQQLSGLTTTSLEALRTYLDGIVAYRHGSFERATLLLTRAFQLDTTFALATSALVEANGWSPASIDLNRVRRLAWQYRSRLTPRDQFILSIRLGSRYPDETPWTERIRDREQATRTMPDNAEAWYYLGDALFHYGALADVADPLPRAKDAFEHAFLLDSLYGGPISHLQSFALGTRDAAGAQLWGRRLLALDTTRSEVRAGAEWGMAALGGDVRAASEAVRRLEEAPIEETLRMFNAFPFDSLAYAHRDELLTSALQRSGSTALHDPVLSTAVMLAWNGGRPAEAHRWLDSLRMKAGNVDNLSVFLVSAPLLGADTVGLDSTLRALPATAHGSLLRAFGEAARGEFDAMSAALAQVRSRAMGRDTLNSGDARILALLEAWAAVERSAPDADRLVLAADSSARGTLAGYEVTSLILPRLLERRGKIHEALTAVRRRYYPIGSPSAVGLAEVLRLEGWLAVKAGDRDGALVAYRRYLFLRERPEPAKQPQRDSVVAELAALTGST